MTFRGFALGLALLVPSVAMAGPISVGGVWATATPQSSDPLSPSLEIQPFWGGNSWDGWHKGVNYLLEEYGVTGLEYLTNGSGSFTSFRFEEDIFNLTKIGGITSRSNGVLGVGAGGALTYSNGYGPAMNSWDDPGQFALFRQVLPETTHYFIGVEDLLFGDPINDSDYNDYVARFDTREVPEPATLLLLGSGMAVIAARKKLAARKARSQATA